MQLILRKEGQPINPILLIFSQFGFDWYWNMILVNLSAIKQLCEEFSLGFPSFEKLFGKSWRIRQTGLIGCKKRSAWSKMKKNLPQVAPS
jgi:hypothetical protein